MSFDPDLITSLAPQRPADTEKKTKE